MKSRTRSFFVFMGLVFLLAASVSGVSGQDFGLDSVGARFGVPVGGGSRGFLEANVFMDWRLPWNWDLGKEWHLSSRLDLTAGWLGSGAQDGALLSAGPELVLRPPKLPISVELGGSFVGLTRYRYPHKNLGESFEFTSHIGLEWDLGEHWRVSSRFQHLSDAGLASPNPGLNLLLFGVSYRF